MNGISSDWLAVHFPHLSFPYRPRAFRAHCGCGWDGRRQQTRDDAENEWATHVVACLAAEDQAAATEPEGWAWVTVDGERRRCTHLGIGLPGCPLCDPTVRGRLEGDDAAYRDLVTRGQDDYVDEPPEVEQRFTQSLPLGPDQISNRGMIPPC